ncbi:MULTISPECIES: hypothetical protein [unclassified Oceanispirochaeta]|uniref:hypothetical protein n=1 Tax=unclassified Oceanispirochaeta TaxID=2635722 RepID=UPI000E09BCFE|nr:MULTISPECIES: hypothetical protein [unclassified Oceanispirochaeta]MBF9016020.1 hypothetical protein [Oceanispirochaeta sp. M2]NPD72483.1 hypothetical protein [Oceanispirochaeta sp. M1]RDG31942.1 hypothetical protein DV872_10255 [Oceanispirochaeta sp. M1]
MKRYLTFIVLVMLSSTLWAQSEFFNTIEFINNTREDIIYLFFSPADSEYWGPDVLGDSRTLSSKGSIEFFISYPNETDSFDFMAIDTSGNVYEIYEESITDEYAAQIVINKTSKSDEIDLDSLEEELIGLEIINETGLELYYLFMSPSDSEMYGIDFMDSETTLQPGASVSVLLFNSNAEVDYDIQGMDAEDDTFSFSLTLDPELEYQFVEITMDDLDF